MLGRSQETLGPEPQTEQTFSLVKDSLGHFVTATGGKPGVGN